MKILSNKEYTDLEKLGTEAENRYNKALQYIYKFKYEFYVPESPSCLYYTEYSERMCLLKNEIEKSEDINDITKDMVSKLPIHIGSAYPCITIDKKGAIERGYTMTKPNKGKNYVIIIE